MELILITNDPNLAKYSEECGVDTIMVDLEIIGKRERQLHLDTVISNHTIDDVFSIRKILKKSKLLVRTNPIHYGFEEEVNKVISAGADALMLPMFRRKEEVERFIEVVNNRAQVYLLLETPQALVRLDDILEVEGIHAIHVGLNDLHIFMGLDFMFELLSGGIVEYIASKVRERNIRFGFGGIARLGEGTLKAELILSEHVRLGSDMVILSRSFKGYKETYDEVRRDINLSEEIQKLRNYITYLRSLPKEELMKNKRILREIVGSITKK